MKTLRLIVVVSLCLGFGCKSRVLTNTPRSAIEQLLLSGAVDRALDNFDLPNLAGWKVHVDFTNLKTFDVEYVRLATRVRVARLGATLVEKAEEADYTVEIACGGLGTEFKSSFVGLPPMPVPNSPVATPEAAVYRSGEQTGIVKLLIFVHQKGRLLSAAHYYAKCDRDESVLLWQNYQKSDNIREGWERSDQKISEKKKQP